MDNRAVAKSVEKYLAAVPTDQLAALQKLRKTIKSIIPDATEVISYGIPTFDFEGRHLVAFAAFKEHCSLFPMSYSTIRTHAAKLERFYVAKGTIRFTPDKPLPVSLVRSIVKARIAENADYRKKKGAYGSKKR